METTGESSAAAAPPEQEAMPVPPPAAITVPPIKEVQPSGEEAVQPEASSRKKTLGQAIKSLFRKKKKGESVPSEGGAESGN